MRKIKDNFCCQVIDCLGGLQPFGMSVFITVYECGNNRQQLMVVKVVVKNKYQQHFTIICTAASGPKLPHIP